jgi:hypothetical protein
MYVRFRIGCMPAGMSQTLEGTGFTSIPDQNWWGSDPHASILLRDACPQPKS